MGPQRKYACLTPAMVVALLKLGVDDFYRLKSLVDTLLAEPA